MPVKIEGEFRLGKAYVVQGCPKSAFSFRANFWIDLVFWSEDTGRLPTASNLLDESQLFFEVRKYVLSEKSLAEEEMRPKEKTK